MESQPSEDKSVTRSERLDSLRERLRTRRHGRTYAEIVQRHNDEQRPNTLSEVPMDTSLWPTAGLSDTQVEMLSEMLEGKPRPS